MKYEQQVHKGCGGILGIVASDASHVFRSVSIVCLRCRQAWSTGLFAVSEWESGVAASTIIDISPDTPQKDTKLLE